MDTARRDLHAALASIEDLGKQREQLVARRDVLREVLDSAGLAGVDLVAGADDPAVKARLRENTERAVSVGVPGAPSYLHALGLFWGQDRLPLIAELEGLQA